MLQAKHAMTVVITYKIGGMDSPQYEIIGHFPWQAGDKKKVLSNKGKIVW
jgi:hypothetical protein